MDYSVANKCSFMLRRIKINIIWDAAHRYSVVANSGF